MSLSRAAKLMAGITLIIVPTIEYGGSFLLKSLSDPAYMSSPLKHDLFRAGHAHAGVIVIPSLVCQVLLDNVMLPAGLVWAMRIALPVAAVLVSAGFFLSGIAITSAPGGAIVLVYLGAITLAAAVIVLGIGLIRSALSRAA